MRLPEPVSTSITDRIEQLNNTIEELTRQVRLHQSQLDRVKEERQTAIDERNTLNTWLGKAAAAPEIM